MSCSGSAVASGSCCCGDRALEGTGVPRCGCGLRAKAQYPCAEEDNKYPVAGPKELDDRVPVCSLALHCLSTAVVLPHSSLLCVFPDQLVPGVIGLPQHPSSVTNFLTRIHGTRERKRHLTSMLRLCTGNFLDVSLQRCRPQRYLMLAQRLENWLSYPNS